MVAFVDEYRDEYGVEADLRSGTDRSVDLLRDQGLPGRS